VNNKEISFQDGISIWTADDKLNGKKYVAFLNVNDTQTNATLPLSTIGKSGQVTVHNLWNKAKNKVHGKIEVSLPAHGAALLSIE
jgi:hypothetical protein